MIKQKLKCPLNAMRDCRKDCAWHSGGQCAVVRIRDAVRSVETEIVESLEVVQMDLDVKDVSAIADAVAARMEARGEEKAGRVQGKRIPSRHNKK